jgi:predicted phosphodiesterase
MKILVIGDTHLSKFEENKYNFLKRIISAADRVIINGDFWDSWFITFDEFINSDWKRLFSLLLSKGTIYIHGNHDPSELSDNRVFRFCVSSSDSYDTKINGIKYHFEQGYRILREVEKSFILNTYFSFIKKSPKFFLMVIKKIESVIFFFFPKMKYDNSIGRRNNAILKEKCNKNVINVFSDTHVQEVDLDNNFANTGSIEYGHASYIVIDEEGLELKEEEY